MVRKIVETIPSFANDEQRILDWLNYNSWSKKSVVEKIFYLCAYHNKHVVSLTGRIRLGLRDGEGYYIKLNGANDAKIFFHTDGREYKDLRRKLIRRISETREIFFIEKKWQKEDERRNKLFADFMESLSPLQKTQLAELRRLGRI